MPGRCQNTIPKTGDKREARRCYADLAMAKLAAQAGDETIATQHAMLHAVSTGVASFGIYAGDPQPALRAFEDIALLSRAARTAVSVGSQSKWFPDPQLLETWAAVARPDPKRFAPHPAAAIDIAVGNVVAHAALGNPSRVEELLEGRVNPNTRLDRYSPVLQHAITRALGRRRRPTALLQSSNGMKRADVEIRAAKLPAVMWPRWVARLAPPRTDHEIAGGALTTATVFTGTRLTHAAALQLLDPSNKSRRVTHVLRELDANPNAETIRAIVGLARYLDFCDVPIDYARRRSLDYRELLPHASWVLMCSELNLKAGNGLRWMLARALLYTMLSGNRVATAPYFAEQKPPSADSVRGFRRVLPSAINDALCAAGSDFLSQLGVDEPIDWSPDLAIVGLAELPSLPGSDSTWATSRPARARIPQTVAAEAYASGRSLTSIAAGYGVGKQTVGRAIDSTPVQRRRGRSRVEVDSEWLRRRYVDDRRTISEIASEVGVSRTLIGHRLLGLGIPTRPRGPASRADAIRAHARATDSPLMAKVLAGQASVQRAERFLTVARHPSLGSAAAELGVNAPTLSSQCKRLSTDAGGVLIERAQRGQPLQLTKLGRQLAAELETVFRGPGRLLSSADLAGMQGS